MSLSDLGLNVANNLSRQGLILLRPAAETHPEHDGAYTIMGEQGELDVNMSPVTGDPDTAGREKQNVYDVEIAASLKQTSDVELAELSSITNQLLDVVVSPTRSAAEALDGVAEGDADFDEALAAATENGLGTKSVLAQAEPSLNFMGDDSTIGVTIPYRINTSEV